MAEEISTYKEVFGLKEMGGSLLFSSLISIGLVSIAAISAKSILDLLVGFAAFVMFFCSLFSVLKILWANKTKVILFKDGIEIYSKAKRGRIKLLWSNISGVRFHDDFLEKSYEIATTETELKVAIPYRLKNMEDFKRQIEKYAGEEHILYIQLSRLVT